MLDDVTGEVLADAIEQLLAAGAFDAWITPIIMKKGRPAFTVRALCDLARLEIVRSTMVTHTGSLGIRASEVRRWPQQRVEQVVVVDGHSIRVKVAAHRVKVEFDDAQAAARALGVRFATSSLRTPLPVLDRRSSSSSRRRFSALAMECHSTSRRRNHIRARQASSPPLGVRANADVQTTSGSTTCESSHPDLLDP